MPAPGEAGVIHDIGYQNYRGTRLGRGYAARALYTHSLRSAYGIGRRARSKILPGGLLAAGAVAALILVVVSSQLPQPVLSSVGLVTALSYAGTAFVAIVAPELVSADLRNSTLPLYFSRPLRRSDYAMAKLAALASAVFVLLAVPLVVMYLGLAFATRTGMAGVLAVSGDFLLGVVAAAIHAAVLAVVALPLASFSGRRVFATGLIIGLFLIAAPVSGMLTALDPGTLGQLAGVLDPVRLLAGVDRWLFGDGLPGIVEIGPYGAVYGGVTIAVLAVGTALLVRRYRRLQA